jgi:hypothetical protein
MPGTLETPTDYTGRCTLPKGILPEGSQRTRKTSCPEVERVPPELKFRTSQRRRAQNNRAPAGTLVQLRDNR